MLKAYFNAHLNALLLSLSQLRQSMMSSLLLVMVIGIAFSLPIFLWLLSSNAKLVTNSWPYSTQLSVFMNKSLSADDIKSVLDDIRQHSDVEFANYISPEEGLKTLEEQTGMEEVLILLDNNPLPPVIEVYPAVFEASRINALFDGIQKVKGVDSVKMDLQWLLRLESIIHLVKQLSLGLMVLLCSAVVLVLGNTIRLAIINRRKEIEVLTLIGATNSYIRRPFLYFGIFYGLCGAVFAWLMISILMILLQQGISNIAALYYTHFYLLTMSWSEGMLLLVIGASLGFIASYLSVSLQSRKKGGEYGF